MLSEIHISPDASIEDALRNLKGAYGRDPSNAELLKTARYFYANGQYKQSLLCCEIHQSRTNKSENSSHLLGYCAAMLSDRARAIECFKITSNKSYPTDWQLLVELMVELE
ncbi:hypothetical protein J8273_6201 [Carpediemonas membranifera]|uniref:Tetratricopeptide repeat protein n=1 Tax=Carpediemonas membranifera TaxID=201153 RepID=A0A8J6AQH8_9EUKA|nr:hypothetical protein J8273_6201 [Carpediemonas membranifera]|eukprot:KAG9391441.1 hypothetical protein J8273_6201 [Carpediemonas membranifera]